MQSQSQGLSTLTEHPQNSRELFRLQQAYPELTLCPLEARLPYRNTACINKCAAYSVNTGVVPIR